MVTEFRMRQVLLAGVWAAHLRPEGVIQQLKVHLPLALHSPVNHQVSTEALRPKCRALLILGRPQMDMQETKLIPREQASMGNWERLRQLFRRDELLKHWLVP